MGALLGLVQFKFSAANDHLMPEVHEVLDNLLKGEGTRTTIDKGDIVDREA